MRHTDVAVVGAGPAGVSAALAAAEAGGSVALIDEQDRVGGHLRWTLAEQPGLTGTLTGARGFAIAAWAGSQIATAGITVTLGSVAWGLFEGNVLTISEGDRSYQLQADAIVIASGSTELTLPFPGWDLPGVMTATAFLKAVNLHRVTPGHRIAVIGATADAAEVRTSAEMAGAVIVASPPTIDGVLVSGSGRVESVHVGGASSGADIAVIALRRQPDPELAFQALCEVGYSHMNGCHVPLRDESLQSSIPGVFIVGDAAGLCTTAEAMAEGRVAGLAAAGSATRAEATAKLARLRTPERLSELRRLSVAESGKR